MAVAAQIPNGMGSRLLMDLDRAFQTIDSGSVLAKFRSFRTGRLYTLGRPKTPPCSMQKQKHPSGPPRNHSERTQRVLRILADHLDR